ncbi:hypothetical protein OAJ82_01965 [Alphaproteobacteria bacterium]|nr:hypothetical protein [Alphaproteobacteria bacterium]
MKILKPSIILVRPQLPENIGMVARAMDNCGLENLILVAPRESWPNQTAIDSSSNSKKIIEKTKIYNSLDDALSNFNYVIATSNRKRFLQKIYVNDHKKFPSNKKIAFVFGPENSGLSNEDLLLTDVIFNINTAKSNTSLNLSHAVVLLCFAWRDYFMIKNKKHDYDKNLKSLALKKDFLYFMKFLKEELEDVGFLYPKSKSKSMFQNIQTMFSRASLSKVEIQTLWGMIKKLRK